MKHSRILAGLFLAGVAAAGCTSSSTMRTSQNTAIINTRAAPVCGGVGAANAAQKQAAVETIRAGYDRYIITGAAAANNVQVTQMPGTYNTYGTASVYGNMGTYNATTTYTPGPTIVSGGFDQAVGVRMFKEGEPGSDMAVSAREILGPKWPEYVKNGVRTCS